MTDLLERLCGYLDRFEGRLCDFLPETFGPVTPQASVSLLPDTVERKYVDGSRCVEIPFEIRLRIGGVSMREKLNAARFFGELAAYMKENPLEEEADDGRIMGITPSGGCTRSAVLQNGEEEYRMRFYVKMAMR